MPVAKSKTKSANEEHIYIFIYVCMFEIPLQEKGVSGV